MASTFSNLGRLELMASGEQDTTWGSKTNQNLQLLEAMAHGFVEVDMTAGSVTLSALNAATDQARNKMIKCTGADASRTLTVPAVSHLFLIWNAQDFDVVVKTAAGTGATVAAQKRAFVFCDGLNVQDVSVLAATPFMLTVLDDANAADARTTLGVPGLASANIFTAEEPIQLRWADNAGGVGPSLVFARDSGSPSAADSLGAIKWRARDTNATMTQYGQIHAQIMSPNAGAVEARLLFGPAIAGAVDPRLALGAGLYSYNATGGDKGADTANFNAYFVYGAQVEQSVAYACVRYETAPGVHGGTLTSGDWRKIPLNLEFNDYRNIVTLDGDNQMLLEPGFYHIVAVTNHFGTAVTRLRLWDVGGAAMLLYGVNGYSNSGSTDPDAANVHLSGRFALPVSATLQLQVRGQDTQSNTGLGLGLNWGVNEVHAQVEIWKII